VQVRRRIRRSPTSLFHAKPPNECFRCGRTNAGEDRLPNRFLVGDWQRVPGVLPLALLLLTGAVGNPFLLSPGFGLVASGLTPHSGAIESQCIAEVFLHGATERAAFRPLFARHAHQARDHGGGCFAVRRK
jgi:hypothetical protein